MLARYRAIIEYFGPSFMGFAAQSRVREERGPRQSVAHAVHAALAGVGVFRDDSVQPLSCAGRTDAGVHALAQCVSFDAAPRARPATQRANAAASASATAAAAAQVRAPIAGRQLRRAVNRELHRRGTPARVVRCVRVPPTFDARFSCLSRRYAYRVIGSAEHGPHLFDHNRAWLVPDVLDVNLARAAAEQLEGEV